MRLGFIGTGEITVAMVTGFCSAQSRPESVLVSPRNAEKAARLAAAFPEVAVGAGNQDVVDRSDWLIVAVLPQSAREILGPLRFAEGQRVISVVPKLPRDELAEIVAPAQALGQVLPLPPAARRLGPVAICPPHDEVSALFGRIGSVVEIAEPGQFDAFWSVTALMAPFYGLLARTAGWLSDQGVPGDAGASYVCAMFHALADIAKQADPEALAALVANSQTPGGLNEQCFGQLSEAGWYDEVERGLDGILARLRSGD